MRASCYLQLFDFYMFFKTDYFSCHSFLSNRRFGGGGISIVNTDEGSGELGLFEAILKEWKQVALA